MYRLHGTTDDVSVQISHFQVFIGTCNFLDFVTSNIDTLIKWQYDLWNKGYKHILCLMCSLTYCYYRMQWGQPLVTNVPMQPQHWGNVTTCYISIHAKLFCEPSPHTWALNHYIYLLMQVTSYGSSKSHTPLEHQYKHLLMCPLLRHNDHVECGNNLLHDAPC